MSCAFASCAMVVGPGVGGVAVAHADLFGIDFFGDCDQKSDMHHPRPGSDVSAQSTRTASIAAAEAPAPTSKIGSQPETLSAAQTGAQNRTLASVPGNVAISEGGGGGLPINASVRAANVPRVSTAPVTRSIVIRATPQVSAPVPALIPAPPAESISAAPLAAPPPVHPEPEGQPAPGAPPTPSASPPLVKPPLAHVGSGVLPVPDSERAGYAEYLRAASTSDLVLAALPGVAGIAGFTLVGAYAGYRQARAVQKALLAPVPTSVLL